MGRIAKVAYKCKFLCHENITYNSAISISNSHAQFQLQVILHFLNVSIVFNYEQLLLMSEMACD